jgi:predicted DNA-binding protein (UPF0278 family)
MDVGEAIEDYRRELNKSKRPMSQEDFERLTKQKIVEEHDETEILIDTIEEFRQKYHNKFKDANTFWEMLYDKIRETL